jgi:hypothetical protein
VEILENFRNAFLFYLPLCFPAYLLGSLTFDYFWIYQPDKLPDFMKKGKIIYQQVEARNGNILPLLILRILEAIASVTGGSIMLAIQKGFVDFQTF